MKKTITILLALLMVLSLAACGGGSQTANTPEPAATAEPTPEIPETNEIDKFTSTTWINLYSGSELFLLADNTMSLGESKGTWEYEDNIITLNYETRFIYTIDN